MSDLGKVEKLAKMSSNENETGLNSDQLELSSSLVDGRKVNQDLSIYEQTLEPDSDEDEEECTDNDDMNSETVEGHHYEVLEDPPEPEISPVPVEEFNEFVSASFVTTHKYDPYAPRERDYETVVYETHDEEETSIPIVETIPITPVKPNIPPLNQGIIILTYYM